jgi:uncharacterized protein YcfJ
MPGTQIEMSLLAIGILPIALAVTGTHAAPSPAGEFDYAPVERVEMLTRIVNVPVAREECWEEPVTYYHPPSYPVPYSYTPTIVGGIVGAVVGRQFGSGSGRDWATIAGSTLGASIGTDYQNRRIYAAGRGYTTTQQRCRVVNDYQQEELADGYLVTYKYNGREYETRMARHPGDRIKVRIDVSPVEY